MTNREQSLRVDMAAGLRWSKRWQMHDLAAGRLVARPGRFARRGWGPDARLEAMDAEGIDRAVMFPTLELPMSDEQKRRILWANCGRMYGYA